MIWTFDFMALKDNSVLTHGRAGKEANDIVSAMEMIVEDISEKFGADEAELIIEYRLLHVAMLAPSLTAGTGADKTTMQLV